MEKDDFFNQFYDNYWSNTIIHWCGRFGNNIQQISNAIHYCEKNRLNFRSPENENVRSFGIDFNEYGNFANPGLFFFHVDSKLGDGEVEFERNLEDLRKERRRICTEYIYPNLKINFENVSDLGDGTVVVHMRSGDLFNREDFYCPVVSSYIQNPLSYYVDIINDYDKAIILTEDYNNPVVAELSKMEKVDIRIIPVSESIEVMLSARNLVTSGVSSFGIACALLSRNVKRLYCSSIYLEEVLNHLEFQDPSVDVIIKEIDMEKYIGFDKWNNSSEQRRIMLEYPGIEQQSDPVFGKLNNNIKVFVSGPLRPSKETVMRCLDNVRRQFKSSEIFFSTWKTSEDIYEIRNKVDYLIESDEPNIDEFFSRCGVSSINSYRMFYGISKIFDFIESNGIKFSENDVVIRMRSDLIFDLNEDFESLAKHTPFDFYLTNNQICTGISFSDWIGISKYKNMKSGWYYKCDESGKEKFRSDFRESWNPEEVVKKNLLLNNIRIMNFEIVSYPENICSIYKVPSKIISSGPETLTKTELKDIFLIRDTKDKNLINVLPDRAYMP